MTQPVPENAVWGVQWEGPVPPADQIPPQPAAPGPDATPSDWEAYNLVADQWRADMLALIGEHEEWWETTVSTFPNETVARSMFAQLKTAHAANPFTRNTTLVWSSPVVWTVVE